MTFEGELKMKDFFSKRNNQLIFSFIVIFIIAIGMQSIQVFNKNLFLGYDWNFHYNRFYDAAQQIKEGNFQYFISMYGFSQTGRIVNANYGPVFAYVQGLVLLVCGSWLKYQLISNFLITFLSMGAMFFLLVKNKIRVFICLPLSVLYSTFYLIQSWTFNQAFGSWGAVILPLGVLAGVHFITSSHYFKDIFFLSLVMSLAIQIHLLTAFFLTIILSVFFIVGLIQTNDKLSLFTSVLIAAVVTVCMTANVWYPLIETNFENDLLRPFVEWNMEASAVKLSLQGPLSNLSITVFSLFVTQFILLVFIVPNNLNKIVIILAFVFFIMSSRLIPWNEIAQIYPSVTIIQFPSRLLLPALSFITLGIALSFETLMQKGGNRKQCTKYSLYCLLLCLCFIGLKMHYDSSVERLQFWKSDSLQATTENLEFKTNNKTLLRKSFDKINDLGKPLELMVKPTSDYLPVLNKELAFDDDFHPYGEYKSAIINNSMNDDLNKSVKNNRLVLTWESNSREETLMPIIVYKRTQVTLNGKELSKKEIKKNRIGALLIHPQKGTNSLHIEYNTSNLFYCMLFITIISWFVFCYLWLRNKFSKSLS